MNPCIITCAITGAESMKEQNSAVPYTTEELVREALLAIEEGASIIHLHVREKNGTPSQNPQLFKAVIDQIHEVYPEIIVQVTTGGSAKMSIEERAEVLKLDVEMATLDCGTINFGPKDIFINRIEDMIFFANKMNSSNIKYELECFEKGHIDTVIKLVKQGVIKEPLHFSFVLGVYGAMNGEERDFLFMKDSIPSNATFSVAGIGKYEFSLAETSIIHGGHVRVGLEDNLYLEKGVLAPSNAALVKKAKELILKHGRTVATPIETRKILGMEKQR